MIGPYPLDPSRAQRGVEAVTVNLVEGLQRLGGVTIEVVSCTAAVTQEMTRDTNGIPVHYIPSSRHGGNLTFGAVDRYRIRKAIDAAAPDILHNQYHFAYPYLLSKPNVPAISTVHGITFKEVLFEKDKRDKIRRVPRIALERMALRNLDHVLCVSEYVKNTIAPLTRATLTVVENPVAQRYFEASNHEKPDRLLFVGTIIRRKNILELLRAIDLLRQRRVVTLNIVGVAEDPRYYNELIDFLRARGLEGMVNLRGVLDDDDIVREYETCAALVLPSLEESAGMVLQQAMAAGKPVIANRTGGIPCIVSHDVTGLLTTPHDIEGLANAMEALLGDRERRGRMGAAGREQALQRFRIARSAEQTLAAYHAVLESEQAA